MHIFVSLSDYCDLLKKKKEYNEFIDVLLLDSEWSKEQRF